MIEGAGGADVSLTLFYLTGNYNKLYNRFFTKIEFTNCIMAVISVK